MTFGEVEVRIGGRRSPNWSALFCLAAFGCSSPEGIQVSIETPTTVAKGGRFQIVAKVQNSAPRPQILVSLDVADSHLEGIVVERTEPPFTEAFHVPIDNTMSYTFNLNINSGAQQVVVLHAYAARSGDFKGEVDFCINTAYDCMPYPIRTIVE